MISGFGQPNVTVLRPGAPTQGAAAEQAAAKSGFQSRKSVSDAAKDDKKLRQASAMLQKGAQRNVAQAMMLVSPKKRA